MAERLGHVLYWAGCVLAALAIGVGAFLSFAMVQRSDSIFVLVVATVVAILIWLLGRACRYVLAGK
jgi:hypothetical protein